MKPEQEKREEFKNILLELASDANLLESASECEVVSLVAASIITALKLRYSFYEYAS